MSIETLSTIGGILIVAFLLGQYYANQQQTKREMAERCRKSEGPGRCGLGSKCDHHGPYEVALARETVRLTAACIASKSGPDRSCPMGYMKCTHHPDWVWIREGVDYKWQNTWHRGDFWAKKSKWPKELARAQAAYSGTPVKVEVDAAVAQVADPSAELAPEARLPEARPPEARPPKARPPRPVRPRIVYPPPLAPEDRCTFQSVAMNMGGYFLAGCLLRLGHDDDHVVPAGGCLGGTQTIAAGTPTAAGVATVDEVPPIEPLHGDGEPCPECGDDDGGVLTTRIGRFGPFLGCRHYPECKYVKRPEDEPIKPLPGDGDVCPKCGETTGATLTTRRARRTQNLFLGCTGYPRCDYVFRPPLEADSRDTVGDDAAMAGLG